MEDKIEELLAEQREECAKAYIAYVARTAPSDWDDHDAMYEIQSARINDDE